MRFLCFDTVKNAFKDRESGVLRPWRNMLAGMTAGVVALVCAARPWSVIVPWFSPPTRLVVRLVGEG